MINEAFIEYHVLAWLYRALSLIRARIPTSQLEHRLDLEEAFLSSFGEFASLDCGRICGEYPMILAFTMYRDVSLSSQ